MTEGNTASSLQRIWPFGAVYGVFWLFGIILLLLWGYEGSFSRLNALHTPFLDGLMPHYTHLGDGVFVATLFGLWVVRKDKGMVLTLIVALVLVTLLIMVLKQQVFNDWNRPLQVFGEDHIHFVGTVALKRKSFPSGHSAAAACVFLFLAWEFGAQRQLYAALIGGISASVAYSRLYIGVHFLGDIVVGTILGVLVGMGSLMWIYPSLHNWVDGKEDSTTKWWLWGLTALLVLFFLGDLYHLYTAHYS